MLPTLLIALLFALPLAAQEEWRSWLNRGVEAYKSARYQEAVEDFQKSVDLSPNEMAPRLYLATALMEQFIPGAFSPENLGFEHKAETEFNRVLQLDSNNLTALHSLAMMSFQMALGFQNEDEKFRKLDESAAWYQRTVTVDPRDKALYYSLGVIDWLKWYPNLMRARSKLGMRPEQPGPLTDRTLRRGLLARHSALIAGGIANLQKALDLDPQYDDAMAYMNLFIRERADLRDTAEEYRTDITKADQWVQKALAVKRSNASTGGASYSPPPPPPPPPASVSQQSPERIHIGAEVQTVNLIRKVDPQYPQEAKRARVEGTVRFTALIGKDGRILNLTLISGHPLLVPSTLEAVRQWEYRPTLLNGEPVEVITEIDVDFSLQR